MGSCGSTVLQLLRQARSPLTVGRMGPILGERINPVPNTGSTAARNGVIGPVGREGCSSVLDDDGFLGPGG
jgi:hypothetical protein